MGWRSASASGLLRPWYTPSTLVVLGSCAPVAAWAHVKWFSAIVDVHEAPLRLAWVLSPGFWLAGLLFLALVFVGFLADGAAARRWPSLATSGERHLPLEEKLIRLATGAYFLLLWDKGAGVPWASTGHALLTPELITHLGWLSVVQFVVAVSVAWRRSCLVGAIGICLLYGEGIWRFGIFHMTDYVFFPTLAGFLALTSVATPAALRLRVPVLSGGLAFGLMWTAIEKFLYPQWTLDVVAHHPDLTFGFPPALVVVLAGFVEFTLAFFFMTGQGLVRFGAAAYAGIFIAAIPEFGHLDAVGHVLIIGILAVVCLHGASPLQRLMGVLDRKPLANATAVSAYYVAALILFFGMYYGLHWAEYS